MHIGLIGGIGVAATVVYYQRLVAAVARREAGRLDLTIVHGDIQELIRNNLADRRDEQAQAFLPLVQRLRDAGADCVALTSLGAHFCANELAARSPLPIISGVAPLEFLFRRPRNRADWPPWYARRDADATLRPTRPDQGYRTG